MKTLSIGDVLFMVEHRNGTEGGPSLRLLLKMPPEPTSRAQTSQYREIWRADCFRKDPHEHWFGPDGEDQEDLEGTEAHDPIRWCIRKLGKLKEIVTEAGYLKVAQKMNAPVLVKHLMNLEDWLREQPSAE